MEALLGAEKAGAGAVIWTIVFLALPAVVEQIMITLVQYVDTAMVGSLGSSATAAVGLTSSTTWLFNGLFNAVAVGFSVQVAQHLGGSRREEARQVAAQGLRFGVLFGLGAGVVGVLLSFPLPGLLGAEEALHPSASLYFRIMACAMPFTLGTNLFSAMLRCAGDTKTPMLLNVAANLLNVVLNFLLIYPTRQVNLWGQEITVPGANWGVGGAAVASAVSMALVCLLLGGMLFGKKSPLPLVWGEKVPFQPPTFQAAWRLGLPVALERTTMCVAQIIITTVITGLGTVSVAANHLAVTAESVSYLPAFGIAVAGTTLVGQAMGARNKALAARFARITTGMGVAVMSLGGVLLYVLAPALIRLFSSEPAVIELGAQVLRIVAFVQPLFGISIVAAGALRGAGDSRAPFLISLGTMWGVRISLSFLLAGSLGLVGVWLAMAAELCVRGVIFLLRLLSNRWQRIDLFRES